MTDLCRAGDTVGRTIRGLLRSKGMSIAAGEPATPESLIERRRRRRVMGAAMIAWAGFACEGPAQATFCVICGPPVITCYPGGACYGGPYFDPNGGGVYSRLEVWPVDGGQFWFAPMGADPTPRVTPPPKPAHHFTCSDCTFVAAPSSDVPSQSLTYWQQFELSVESDPTLTLDEFNAVRALNQPGVSVSFDDSTSSDVPGSPPSDWPSDDSSFDLGAPNIDTPSALADDTDYNSGDGNSPVDYSVGEPVNSATGNVFRAQLDYLAFGAFPLRFERFYNSLNPIPAFSTTELGTGWRGSYDSAIVLINGQGVPAAVVIRPDGQSLLFTNSGGTQWSPGNPAVRASLVSQTDASGNLVGWTYTTGDDFTEIYNASGQLQSIANRTGLTQTLSYNSANQLARVTDPFGHQLLFSYNPQGQLTQVTDPAGNTYQYTYDANRNLRSVTYPDTTTRQYLYENAALPNAMTGLVDENGSRFVTWGYDAQGRAVSSVVAGGIQPVSIVYNSDGSSSVTDARGTTRLHTFTRDVAGALRPTGNTMTGCASSCPAVSSSLTYDFTGLTATGTDPNGATTTLTFNARGLLTSRTEAVGTPLARTVNITYHPVFHLPTQIAFPDRVVNYTYDGQGNRTSKSVTAGNVTRSWTYSYNAQGLLTQLTGPRTDVPQVWSFAYDTQGHLTSTQDPLGHVTQFSAYDVHGHPLTVVDPNGTKLSFTYDVRGRLLTRSVAARTWSYRRDPAGQITGISYANGSTVALSYDAAHRLTDITNSVGIRQHRSLNVAGDVVQIALFDASNTLVRQVTYGQDGLGRLTSTTDANNQTTTVSYDSNDNPIGSTDPLGRNSSVSYDALNRPVVLTDAAGQVTTVQFNAYNQLTQVAAPNGAITRYTYDSFRQLVQDTSPDRGTNSITYSAAGLPISRLDGRGVTTSATYDALNRITQLSFSGPGNPGTPNVWLQSLGTSVLSDNASFTYDQGTGCTFGIGRICARQDQSGTELYAYDAFGNLTQQTHTLLGYSYSTQYAYDAANQLIQMIYPDGRLVSYTRDTLERVTAVQSTVNQVAAPILSSVQYRADGSPTNLTFGNGLAEARSYDPVGRMISQLVGGADSRTYGFDALGNMTSRQTVAESSQFGYDPLSRLTTEQRTQGTSSFSNIFSYDSNGNRLSENNNGTSTQLSYVPNSNQLIQVGSKALTLDAAGNTISDTNGARGFYYSTAGHLQWIAEYGLPIAGYLYNATGQRVGKLTLQGITLYHYDIFGRLISETTLGSQPSRDYIWSGAAPVAQIDHWIPIGNMLQLAHCAVGQDGKIDWVTYLHTDGLGSPRIGTDVAQNVVWRWDGEAFGETTPSQAVPIGAHAVLVNLRNPGQYFDQESGLFNNGARYYNPKIGRYISSDPIGLSGGINTYSYVDANPLAYLDPFGLDLTPGQQAAVVAAAQDWSQSNVPYKWGGSTKAGADCSGSVSGIYNDAGINIGRLTSQQFTQSPFSVVPEGSGLQPGDVGVYPGHVVIYGGSNTGVDGSDVWSASHTGGNPFGPASSSWYGTPTWYRYSP